MVLKYVCIALVILVQGEYVQLCLCVCACNHEDVGCCVLDDLECFLW